MKTDIRRNSKFVSDKGGWIEVVDLEGEVVAKVKVPAGIVDAGPYFALLPYGGQLFVGDGLSVLDGPAVYAVERGDNFYHSAANPDFQPSTADEMSRKLNFLMGKFAEAETARVKGAREASAARVDVMPSAEALVVE